MRYGPTHIFGFNQAAHIKRYVIVSITPPLITAGICLPHMPVVQFRIWGRKVQKSEKRGRAKRAVSTFLSLWGVRVGGSGRFFFIRCAAWRGRTIDILQTSNVLALGVYPFCGARHLRRMLPGQYVTL